jgi:hypothetical protein
MYGTDKLKDPETIRKYTNSLNVQEERNGETTAIDNGNWTIGKQITTTAAEGVIKKEVKGK